MASIKVIPKLEKIKKDGQVPIYLRLIKNRRTKFISLGISVLPKLWDYKNNKVKSGHANSGRLNSFIQHKLTEATDIVLESETKNKHLGTGNLKAKILGGGSVDFIDYFKKELESLKQIGKVASHKKLKAILSKLEKYVDGKKLYFDDINTVWLKNYEFYMKSKLGNAQNTVHSNLKVIRKLFNDAIKDEIISEDIYPFEKYKLKWDKRDKKDYLEESEIQQIMNLNLERGCILDVHRNMFIFSCFSGGLRISDLLFLKWEHYDGNLVNFICRKTGKSQSIKVPKVGKTIMEIYAANKNESSDFVFPILKPGEITDAKTEHDAISSATAFMNKNLKTIADLAGLKGIKLSSHWARRSFTSLALAKGMNLDVASKILGHGGQTVTLESYARYNQDNLHKAMEVFD